MKKVIYLLMGFLLVLSACKNTNNKTSDKEVIKIGANFTLTGNVSYWSTELKKGMDLAIEELDSTNNRQIQIVYEDNEFKTNKAVSIFKKFATVDKVSAVISCFTPIGQSIRPSAEKYKIPMIATATSAKDFALTNKWTFRDFLTHW